MKLTYGYRYSGMRTKRVEMPASTTINKGDIVHYNEDRHVTPGASPRGLICGVAAETVTSGAAGATKILIHDDLMATFFHPVKRGQKVSIQMRGRTCDVGDQQTIDIGKSDHETILIVDVDEKQNGVYWQMNWAMLITEKVV